MQNGPCQGAGVVTFKNILKRILFGLIFVVFLYVIFAPPIIAHFQLANSIKAFSNRAFASGTKEMNFHSTSYGFLFSDVGGYWDIKYIQNETKSNPDIEFNTSYEDDKLHFIDEVREIWPHFSADELAAFEFSKGEVTLGVGTVCAKFPCNYYVLKSSKRAIIFLSRS